MKTEALKFKKSCFSMTFDISISYILPENFIEIPQVVQKI